MWSWLWHAVQVSSVPGIDEAMALSTVLSHVESGKFEVIVFDTAPTGHMLRLLQLPGVLKVRGHLDIYSQYNRRK